MNVLLQTWCLTRYCLKYEQVKPGLDHEYNLDVVVDDDDNCQNEHKDKNED